MLPQTSLGAQKIRSIALRLSAVLRPPTFMTTGLIAFPILVMLTFAGCALARKDASVTTVSHRFIHPPQQAASCFARNAEEHSSALVSEVRQPDARGHVEVIVRVKNGVTYAIAELRPMGAGSNGTIRLAVFSSGGNQELVRSLVESC